MRQKYRTWRIRSHAASPPFNVSRSRSLESTIGRPANASTNMKEKTRPFCGRVLNLSLSFRGPNARDTMSGVLDPKERITSQRLRKKMTQVRLSRGGRLGEVFFFFLFGGAADCSFHFRASTRGSDGFLLLSTSAKKFCPFNSIVLRKRSLSPQKKLSRAFCSFSVHLLCRALWKRDHGVCLTRQQSNERDVRRVDRFARVTLEAIRARDARPSHRGRRRRQRGRAMTRAKSSIVFAEARGTDS